MNRKNLALAVSLVLGCALASSAAKMKVYRGKVTAHADGKLSITVDDGSTGDWSVDPKAVATEGRKRLPMNEVHVGDEVSVTVSQEGVIHRLSVLREPAKKAAKAASGYWATQKGKGRWWTGEVISLDEAKKEIQIRKPGAAETTHFVADARTLTYLQPVAGKKAKGDFSAVKVGVTVDAYALDGRTTQIVVHVQ